MELTDYLDREGLKAMSFNERDDMIEKLLGPETSKQYYELLTDVNSCPHYEACQKWYDFIVKHNIDTLFMTPIRPEAEAITPLIIEHGVKGKKVILDVGCGTGVKTVYYALINPNAKITAFDFSKPLLSVAEKRAKKYDAHIEFINADLVRLEDCQELKGRQFESVICTNMISEGGDAYVGGCNITYDALLSTKIKALAGLTAQGGQLVLNCNPNNLADYRDELCGYLKAAGFGKIKHKAIEYDRLETTPEKHKNLTLICKKI
jgi:precorrin-6B methylase 2